MRTLVVLTVLTFFLCIGLGVKLYQMSGKNADLQDKVEEIYSAVVIPEGEMLMQNIANYMAGCYHVNGWPSENQIFDLGPGAKSRHWCFSSLDKALDGSTAITIQRADRYEFLIAIVHPDSSIVYLPNGHMPAPQRAG